MLARPLLACLLALAACAPRLYLADDVALRQPTPRAQPFAADGRRYLGAVPRDGDRVHLDTRTGEVLRRFPGPALGLVVLAPSGTLAASPGARPGELHVWDPATGARVTTLHARHGESIRDFEFSADERALTLATAAGLEHHALAGGLAHPSRDLPGIRAIARIPGARDTWLVAVEQADRRHYAIVDPRRPRARVLRMPAPPGVDDLRVSPDGRWFAVSANSRNDATLTLWSFADPRRPALYLDDWTRAIAFSPDGRRVALAFGGPCAPPEHVVVWTLDDLRAVLDLATVQLTALHLGDRALIVAHAAGLDRVDLASGRRTPILAADCPTCVTICG